VRVGSKVRRVYDGPRTPFERVRMCGAADGEQVVRLEELRKSLDPFQLARAIERKLDRIYCLANRRLSPRQEQETGTSQRREGGGKDARSASLEIEKRFPISHRHGDESTVTLQMSRRSSPRVTFSNGLTGSSYVFYSGVGQHLISDPEI